MIPIHPYTFRSELEYYGFRAWSINDDGTVLMLIPHVLAPVIPPDTPVVSISGDRGTFGTMVQKDSDTRYGLLAFGVIVRQDPPTRLPSYGRFLSDIDRAMRQHLPDRAESVRTVLMKMLELLVVAQSHIHMSSCSTRRTKRPEPCVRVCRQLKQFIDAGKQGGESV